QDELRKTWWWQNHPYNSQNVGGTANSTTDFFTDFSSKLFYKQRMRYIIARWGYSPNILGYELMQEIDLFGGFWGFNGKNKVRTWYQEMIQYGRSLDSKHLYVASVMYPNAARYDDSGNLNESFF